MGFGVHVCRCMKVLLTINDTAMHLLKGSAFVRFRTAHNFAHIPNTYSSEPSLKPSTHKPKCLATSANSIRKKKNRSTFGPCVWQPVRQKPTNSVGRASWKTISQTAPDQRSQPIQPLAESADRTIVAWGPIFSLCVLDLTLSVREASSLIIL